MLSKLKNIIKEPKFIFLQSILQKIPLQPVKLYCFIFLEFKGEKPRINYKNRFEVREIKSDDLKSMSALERKNISIFLKRLEMGSYCIVGVNNSSIIGYMWFTDKNSYTEERTGFKILIPKDSIYSYDAFILPKYRLKGLWVSFQMYMLYRMGELSRSRIITFVDYGNNISLRSHLRFGYLPFKKIFILRVFGKSIFFEKKI